MDDEHADGRRQKLDGDRAARAPGSDKKRSCPLHVSSVVRLCRHEGEAVQHVAVPGAVRIAADNAHDPEHPGTLGTGGAVSERGELVRHRDEDPVHVRRRGQARHDDVEVSRQNLHRDAYAVVAALGEGAGQAGRGLGVLNRVTDNREQPGRSAHVRPPGSRYRPAGRLGPRSPGGRGRR